MRSISFVAALCLVPASLAAQSTEGWQVQWEQLRMDVSGADAHIGDLVTIKGAQSFTTPPQINYQVLHDPIDLNLNSKNAFRTSVKYRGEQWGFSAAGWFVRTEGSLSGRVTSPADVTTSTQHTWETRSVLMWNELLTPVGNELEPSGYSPVSYRASESLKTYAVDAAVLVKVASHDSVRLDLIAGGKIARIRTAQEQGQDEEAFFVGAFGPGRAFRNLIGLSSTAEAHVDGAGPTVGLASQATWRRLTLEAAVAESLVFASTKQTGMFADVDAISIAAGPTGPYTPCPLSLASSGCYSIRSDWAFSSSGRTTIPVTELQLKVLFHVTRHIGIGASSFTSVWTGVPTSPEFTITHSDAGPGLDWDRPQQTLRFGSAGLIVSFGF